MMRRCLWLLLVAALLTACDGDYPFSRKYPCYFAFKYETHMTSRAFAAVQSAGMYAVVTTSGDGRSSLRHVYVQANDGKSDAEDHIIRNDDENYRTFQLGRSNSTGVIVGTTNFNGRTAYDGSCPNCTALQGLAFSGNRQQVICERCHRTYDLETGGVLSGEKGDALMRYDCQFNGVWLIVTNGLKP